MSDGSTASALEIGKRLGKVSAQMGTQGERDSAVRSLMSELILSRATSPEDALALTAWGFELLQEVHRTMPVDSPEAVDRRHILAIATTLVGRSLGALESVTGIPSVALSGEPVFSQ